MGNMRKVIGLAVALLLLLPGSVVAQGPTGCESDYTVKSGDWLSKIADQYYGDYALYPAIVLATNAKAASDDNYATITDPYLIEPDWKLCIPDIQSAQSGLMVEALRNATYQSEWTNSKQAPLTDGEYVESIVPGAASKIVVRLHPRMAFGYTGDGQPFSAVILFTSAGGSGTFYELAAVVQQNGEPMHVAATKLGDRVRIDSLAVEGAEIVVRMVTQGPDDPMCCPTQRVEQRCKLGGDQLVMISTEVLGTDIRGTTWQWERFAGGDGSKMEVEDPSKYTLTLRPDGTYEVKADCNLSSGSYTLDGSQLILEPGPTTLAECEPGSLYSEFLAKLGHVRTYVFHEGKLVLNLWADAGDMFFIPATGSS
ncbi:MAG TPA: META domain-containing protein [Anaerolineae bacterium]|nr:META domain-containing protein [Anaerolineae bacterium]